MDRKLIAIVFLTISAVALLLANFENRSAQATTAVVTRDFEAVTAQTPVGGDSLYILDARSGMLAIFEYDQNTRSLQPRKVIPASDLFR